MSQEYEGWCVTPRPALVGIAVFVLLLVALVVGSALFYNRHYAPQTRPNPRPFPAPELETIDTAPSDRLSLPPPTLPAGIDRAMAETAAQGDALWGQK